MEKSTGAKVVGIAYLASGAVRLTLEVLQSGTECTIDVPCPGHSLGVLLDRTIWAVGRKVMCGDKIIGELHTPDIASFHDGMLIIVANENLGVPKKRKRKR